MAPTNYVLSETANVAFSRREVAATLGAAALRQAVLGLRDLLACLVIWEEADLSFS